MDSRLRRAERDYYEAPSIETLQRLNSELTKAGQEPFLPLEHLQIIFEDIIHLLDGATVDDSGPGEGLIAQGVDTFRVVQGWYSRPYGMARAYFRVTAYNVFGDEDRNAHLTIKKEGIYRNQSESHAIDIFTDDVIYGSWHCDPSRSISRHNRQSHGLHQFTLPLNQPWVYSAEGILDFCLKHWDPGLGESLFVRNPDPEWRKAERAYIQSGLKLDYEKYASSLIRTGVLQQFHNRAQIDRVRNLLAMAPLAWKPIDDELQRMGWVEIWDEGWEKYDTEPSATHTDIAAKHFYQRNGMVNPFWCQHQWNEEQNRCSMCGNTSRRNPDPEWRKLEREYHADPTPENYVRLRKAQQRAGITGQYIHDCCDNCIFLGSEGKIDYYFHPEESFRDSLVIARYGHGEDHYFSVQARYAGLEPLMNKNLRRAGELARQRGLL